MPLPTLRPIETTPTPAGFTLNDYEPGQQVTIYTVGEMMGNVRRCEAKILDCGFQKYAQYTSVPFARFIPKGKRSPVGVASAESKPFMLILPGWDHPEPASMFGEAKPSAGGQCMIREGRYSGHDSRWKTDFAALINPHLEAKGIVPILDARAEDRD